jgi:hypothetical protein
VGGTAYPNNAWVAGNNPAGDGRYVTDASCPRLNDPLTVLLAGGNSFAPGTYAGLWFTAPPDTAIATRKRHDAQRGVRTGNLVGAGLHRTDRHAHLGFQPERAP